MLNSILLQIWLHVVTWDIYWRTVWERDICLVMIFWRDRKMSKPLPEMKTAHMCLAWAGLLAVIHLYEYLNKGRPTWWHLLYYVNLLLNMFQMLVHPSSGACDYLLRCCVGWLEACWCYVAGLSVGDVVSKCRLNHY